MIRYGTPKHAGTSMKVAGRAFFWGSERFLWGFAPQKNPHYREGGFTASTSASGRSIGDEILSLDVSMHDALGMDVRDCSLPIRQTLQILHSICPKKGWTTSEKEILFGKLFILQWIWNHYIFRHSNHPRWASCTVSIHRLIRLTYLYGYGGWHIRGTCKKSDNLEVANQASSSYSTAPVCFIHKSCFSNIIWKMASAVWWLDDRKLRILGIPALLLTEQGWEHAIQAGSTLLAKLVCNYVGC